MNTGEDVAQRVAVAMSGGVDSSCAALLLQEGGREVFGITAIMTDELSRCCAPEEVDRAAEVCKTLGISHHIAGVQESFSANVVEYFTSEYLAGRTPSPCVMCNRHIKFGALLEGAKALGGKCIATGHYARNVQDEDGVFHLLRGRDREKDQSYFLAMLSQEQLAEALLPLGDMTKDEIKQLAVQRDLPTRRSSESQDVCFIMDGTHGAWIDVRSFDTRGPGAILDPDGKKLGEHLGIHHYTVGQRKGLGIATGAPVYVIRIDPAKNTVTVGPREAAMSRRLTATGVSWVGGKPPGEAFRAATQVRYKHDAAVSDVTVAGDGKVTVAFEEPQFAVTPGQLAVFYDGDEALGGGWIG